MFAAWKVGACLCVPNVKQRMLPTQYVVDSNLSVWFSVPSAALLMKQMRALTPGVFANLRLVLFCGEALPVGLAQAFAEAAPDAVLENIYGPTELTLACTHYRWTADSPAECENEVVPIGDPFAGMDVKVVDEDLADVAPGEAGELLMSGPQRALGYWNDPERTAVAFMIPPGETELFYRTGDRVRRPNPGAPMTFLGRVDSQIKLNGYRVELGEIEAVMQREAGVDAAVALGWPKTPAGASGVVGFVVGAQPADIDAVLDRMQDQLPRYMVPREIRVLEAFPLNQNGKIDRKALMGVLEAEDAAELE
jgi:acyl-coenzyme A synthetase/AMP-(fatty) acid ligase